MVSAIKGACLDKKIDLPSPELELEPKPLPRLHPLRQPIKHLKQPLTILTLKQVTTLTP